MKHIIDVRKFNIDENRKKQLWKTMSWFIYKDEKQQKLQNNNKKK